MVVRRHLALAVVLAVLLSACQVGRSSKAGPSSTSAPQAAGNALAATQKIFYKSVELTIPAAWPVVDGAHAGLGCSSVFAGHADRAYLGVSDLGAPSCAAPAPGATPPPADGVWLEPGELASPLEVRTVLPSGEVVYLAVSPHQSMVAVWYRNVSIRIGIGPDAAVEREILDSIRYSPGTPDTPVLARCPPATAVPPRMPVPAPLTSPISLPNSSGQLTPELPAIQPHVSANVVWDKLFRDFGAGLATGSLQWSILFGSYSAPSPASVNPNGSLSPEYQNVPTWLIEGHAVQTDYGPCGTTILAPYNADTGQSMGVQSGIETRG